MEEKILAVLDEPRRPGEIAEMTGIDKAEVSKVLKKLKAEEKVFAPKRCFYQRSLI